MVRWHRTELPQPVHIGELERILLSAQQRDPIGTILVEEKLNASALALERAVFESYLRGSWLLYAATDAQMDEAGRDRCPENNVMLDGLDKAGMPLTSLN